MCPREDSACQDHQRAAGNKAEGAGGLFRCQDRSQPDAESAGGHEDAGYGRISSAPPQQVNASAHMEAGIADAGGSGDQKQQRQGPGGAGSLSCRKLSVPRQEPCPCFQTGRGQAAATRKQPLPARSQGFFCRSPKIPAGS